jgi:hypothetical protein
MAVLIVALTDLSSTNLTNTANLQGQRSLEYSADGAVDAAVQILRYASGNGAPGQSPITGSPCPTLTVSGSLAYSSPTLYVFCGGETPGASAPPAARLVLFCASLTNSPCLTVSGTKPYSAVTNSGAVLEAEVLFNNLKDATHGETGIAATVTRWVQRVATG